MKAVLQNPEWFRKRAVQASELIPEYFGLRKIGTEFVSFYKDVIASRREKFKD